MHLTRVAAALALSAAIGLLGCDSDRRNGYMLALDSGADFGYTSNPLNKNGFGWWWHSFVGKN